MTQDIEKISYLNLELIKIKLAIVYFMYNQRVHYV